jgi:hypothetical protein
MKNNPFKNTQAEGLWELIDLLDREQMADDIQDSSLEGIPGIWSF